MYHTCQNIKRVSYRVSRVDFNQSDMYVFYKLKCIISYTLSERNENSYEKTCTICYGHWVYNYENWVNSIA